MNQGRNIIINLIANIICSVLIVKGAYWCTSDDPPMGKFIMFCVLLHFLAFGVSVLVQLVIDTNIFHWTPPMGLAIFAFLGYHYLWGNVKFIRSMHGAYLTRYQNGEISIYKFGMFDIVILDTFPFNGTSDAITRIRVYLETIETDKKNNTLPDIENFKYKDWDGMLDAESKRIHTINKIRK